MPIYEYQCEKCRRILSFLVRNVATHQPPVCPKCGHPKMTRAISRFAAPKGNKKAPAVASPDSQAAVDNAGIPHGLEKLVAETEGLDENNPRALGHIMRKVMEQTPEQVPEEMHEVVRRLESGDAPEKIEQDMGDLLGDDETGGGAGGAGENPMLYEG
jgi:putative FmdB family regulatory protein